MGDISSITTSSQIHTLRWQFQLTWKLAAEAHLPVLTDDACLWEPAPGSWNVRRSPDGHWRPDWAVPEPNPAPTVTVGWLTWHVLWWWGGALAALRGETPPAHTGVFWPGSAAAARERLAALAGDWAEVLSRLEDGDLARPMAYPWSEPRPLGLMLAWVNSELMKNVAEIGYVRLLYAAGRP